MAGDPSFVIASQEPTSSTKFWLSEKEINCNMCFIYGIKEPKSVALISHMHGKVGASYILWYISV